MTLISPLPIQHFVDGNGNALSGGKLFTYAAGTTTKQATYTDSTGGTPNTNPIILNSRGEANVWLTQGQSYKFILSPPTDTDPPTNPIWTVDNINGGITTIPTNTILGNSSGVTALPTGQTLGFGLILSAGVLSSVLQNFIAGLQLSNDSISPNSVIDVSNGSATDNSNSVVMTLGNFTKSTLGSWTAGTGNFGMGVGITVSANTWYFVHLILNNGNPDIYFDTDATAANAPVGTTNFRRIGSILTGGANAIIPFLQQGFRFFWRTPRADVVGNTSITNSNTSVTLTSFPPNIKPYGRIRANATNTTTVASFGFYSLAETATPGIGKTVTAPVANVTAWTELDILISLGQAIAVLSSITSNNSVGIDSVSWVDEAIQNGI